MKEQTTYRDVGVDIDEADRAVSAIKRLAAKTLTSNVLTSIGSFGAGFALKGWRDPVLEYGSRESLRVEAGRDHGPRDSCGATNRFPRFQG